LWIANRLKATQEKKQSKGFDGHKRINGRKRHIIVDSLGFLLSVCVTAANIQDRQALPDLCTKMKGKFPRMRLIFADSGYEGRQNNVLLDFGWLLSVVRRPNKKETRTAESFSYPA
jgi:putative transposase